MHSLMFSGQTREKMQKMNIKTDPEGPCYELVDHVKIEMTKPQDAMNNQWTHLTEASPVENWRTHSTELKLEEQLKLMQENGVLVDCAVNCRSSHSTGCHKLFLVRISPVLEQKLANSDILFLDCDTDTCEALIRFAYTNVVVCQSTESILNLHRLAKKIACDRLANLCILKYRGSLKIATAIQDFDMLDVEEDIDLTQQCLEFIATHGDDVLNQTPFMYMVNEHTARYLSKMKIRMFLSEENMNISSELILVNALELWAEKQVKLQGKQCSHNTIKEQVALLLPKIRILTLNQKELREWFGNTNMLTDDEQILVRAYKEKRLDTNSLPSFVNRNELKRNAITTAVKHTLVIPQERSKSLNDGEVPETPLTPVITAVPSTSKQVVPCDSGTRKRGMHHRSPSAEGPNKRRSFEKVNGTSPCSSHSKSEYKESIHSVRDYSSDQKSTSTTGEPGQTYISLVTLESPEKLVPFDCALFVRDAEDKNNFKTYELHRIFVGRFGGFLYDLINGQTSDIFILDVSNRPPLPLYKLESDISLDISDIIIKYLYNDNYSCSPKELPRVYSLAKCWKMTPILKRCAKQLQYSLTTHTVWYTLQVAQELKNKPLEEKCFEEIKRQPLKCFDITADELKTISPYVVKKISELSTIDVRSEADIIVFVENWARAKLTAPGNEPNKNQIQSFLTSIIPNLRFLAVSLEDFNEFVSKTEILKEDDRNAVFAHLSGNPRGKHNKELSPFINQSNISRFKTYHTGPALYRSYSISKNGCKPVQLIVNDSSPGFAAIQFTVDQPVNLHGFTIQSQSSLENASNNDYLENMHATLWSLDLIKKKHTLIKLLLKEFKPQVFYNRNIKLMFDHPVPLKTSPIRWYVLMLKLKSKGCYSFKDISQIETRPVIRKFMDVQFKCLKFEYDCGYAGIFESLLVSKIDAPIPT
ncbi:Hypothetical predicted protein [Cloeon dipterum]|uniref:BTB domain-containing protein n=1 Tax=Cloeon dipterum TaxID=197152 RepID=A0A8S1CTN9_9INSE|nr:Hypothetical predicted protein [Cloeon dipterum]